MVRAFTEVPSGDVLAPHVARHVAAIMGTRHPGVAPESLSDTEQQALMDDAITLGLADLRQETLVNLWDDMPTEGGIQ